MWFKKTQLETPFKGDDVKASVKTSNCENLVLYFSEEIQKIAEFAMLFWFSVTKQSFETGFGFLQWSEIPTLPTSLKIERHFSTTAAIGNSVFFKWKILSDDRSLYLHASQWNSRSDVDGLTHTKQLLNLLCIVYVTRKKSKLYNLDQEMSQSQNSCLSPDCQSILVHFFRCLALIWIIFYLCVWTAMPMGRLCRCTSLRVS